MIAKNSDQGISFGCFLGEDGNQQPRCEVDSGWAAKWVAVDTLHINDITGLKWGPEEVDVEAGLAEIVGNHGLTQLAYWRRDAQYAV